MGGGGGSTTSSGKSFVAEINVTPFVDILLVLLIIFMVTAPAMTRSIGISLPKEKTSAPAAAPISRTEFYVVGLDSTNGILFKRKRYDPKTFYKSFPDLTKNEKAEKVFIQSDRKVPYERLLQLMVYLQNQGYENIGLVFEEK